MIIVLAILAALAAMAWPSLRKPLARHRLTAAAKQLRAELLRTRLDAIQRGEPLQFRYLPGTAEYRVEQLGAASQAQGPDDVNAGAWNGGFSNAVDDLQLEVSEPAATSESPVPVDGKKLSGEISFACEEHLLPDELAGLATSVPSPAALVPDEGVSLETSHEALSAEWSPPIVFYPNGRTTDAEIALVGDRNYRIRLSVRGVTGAVSIGDVVHPPEDAGGQPHPENPVTTIESRLRQESPSMSESSSLVKR
jgi:Tfp pilus assembly protein FimT